MSRERVNRTASREALKQSLRVGQEISQRASTGQGFDPRGGIGVLAAQLGTAAIGAFAQSRARKQLAEQEQASQQAFSSQFPQFAGLSGQLTPETRQAVIQAQLSGQIKQQFKDAPTPLSPQGKLASDVESGFLPKGTTPQIDEKKRATTFKETRDLRKEFTKNSTKFIDQKGAFDRVQASAEDPSAAGDLALIFNYMKVLDPGSTVREGEFATAQQSGSLPQTLIARYNKIIAGERLSDVQRNDFVNRAGKLFDKALKTQKRRVDQFKGIAERNNLPVDDVLLDLIGDDPIKAEAVAAVEQPQAQIPISDADRQGAIAELERRRSAGQSLIADNGGAR